MKEWRVSFDALSDSLINAVKLDELDNYWIGIIFMADSSIKKINSDFRKVDEVTDVLSFDLGENDNGEKFGEVYVAPNYVLDSYSTELEKFETEIVRLIVHGILHIAGMQHDSKFDDSQNYIGAEPMYEEQERIVSEVMKDLGRT